MKWNADAFFAVGKTHTVCQDYARAELDPDMRPYIVVCDGCSSSPDTDFGARLLAAAAIHRMHADPDASLSSREEAILFRADATAGALGLPRTCLDATLLTATLASDGQVRVSMRGDGVVAGRLRDGTLVIHRVEHARGAPRYLSYDLDQDRLADYRAQFGDVSSVASFSTHGPDRAWSPDTQFNDHPDDWVFPADRFDLVVLLSDGASSFQRVVETSTSRSLETVPLEDVVAQILDIKGFAGAFLKRRCHKFLTKFCAERRWQHADDFSAAAIWTETP